MADTIFLPVEALVTPQLVTQEVGMSDLLAETEQ